MDKRDILRKLPDALLPWYEEHKRDLPWRADREPYHIWLSEIMLQQTRVEAVRGYYTRFLQALPSISDLAKADDSMLHKLWEGLGYYSRVRNLKKAAQVIVEQHSGTFPREHSAVLALPGIGEYTAGAICSIVFDQPTPAVDGNVLRLVSRLTDDHTPTDLLSYRKLVQDGLRTVYPAQAGAFTQALMELGATVCGPNRKPKCECCPCEAFCMGYQCGTAEELPVRLPKRQRRQEEMTVFVLSCGSFYALQKRDDQGLLAGLWQFPNASGKLDTETALEKIEEMGLRPKEILRTVERKHIFTHVEWNMRGIYVEVADQTEGLVWFSCEQIRTQTALPTAFRQFWEELENV